MDLQKHINHLIINLKQNFDSSPHLKFIPTKFQDLMNIDTNNIQNCKKSAVIILLFNENSETFSILIQRAKYEGNHSGQIALPGGKSEIFDKSLAHTAIRELHEELGILINMENIIGELNPVYIPISQYMVYPFVAFIPKPNIIIDSFEIDHSIIYPISELLDNKSIVNLNILIQSKMVEVPAFKIQNHEVWGATSMILNDFKSRILNIKSE